MEAVEEVMKEEKRKRERTQEVRRTVYSGLAQTSRANRIGLPPAASTTDNCTRPCELTDH